METAMTSERRIFTKLANDHRPGQLRYSEIIIDLKIIVRVVPNWLESVGIVSKNLVAIMIVSNSDFYLRRNQRTKNQFQVYLLVHVANN